MKIHHKKRKYTVAITVQVAADSISEVRDDTMGEVLMGITQVTAVRSHGVTHVPDNYDL